MELAKLTPSRSVMFPPGDCTRCPALVANRQRIVRGYGDPAARLMLVGEAPGYRGADRTGVPFTGDRSGRRVQALLIALGLSQESAPAVERPQLRDVWLSNVVRCNPPGNRNPTAVEVANCTPWLRAELEMIRPVVVATLGNFAARWAFGELLGQEPPAGVRELHGQTWRAGTVTVLCLVHPARASNAQMAIAARVLQAQLVANRC
ncbi:MAG: uracil-DNA glycosylase [Caldilineales bacterium]